MKLALLSIAAAILIAVAGSASPIASVGGGSDVIGDAVQANLGILTGANGSPLGLVIQLEPRLGLSCSCIVVIDPATDDPPELLCRCRGAGECASGRNS